MRSTLLNGGLKTHLKTSVKAVVVATLTFGGCALSETVDGTDNLPATASEAQQTGALESIEDMREYLESLNLVDVNSVRGSSDSERLESQASLYQSYARRLSTNGINKEKLLKIIKSDEGARIFLDRYFTGRARFEDYLNLSEMAVIARVGDALPDRPMTFAGPSFFELDVSNNLLETPDIKKIVVINAFATHMRTLETGKECVFFLSPTLTQHINSLESTIPEFLVRDLPSGFLMDSFPAYCSSDGETFSASTQIGGLKQIKKSEILNLAKTIP